MNVEQVRSLDKKTASGIFAAAALASAADPGLHQSSLKKEFGDFVNPLLNDIRTKLKLAAEDNSPRARRSINEFLGQELKAVVLRTVDTSEVLSAAGQAGRLSPSLYIPEMPESFLRLFTSLGVKAQHVSDAIQRPDEYQHLYIDQSDGGSAPSLYMKLIETREPFWILVQAHRVGRVQIAHSAWRLYGREIDLTSVTEPLTALKKFVDVFGVTITVNGRVSICGWTTI